MTDDFRRRGLIEHDRMEEYDGTTAVVRTAHMDAADVEFLRWRAERWMKLRHLPRVLRAYPGFVLRHAPQMLAHTFRGATWRSAFGLENQRDVFNRYKRLRAREREYVAEAPDDSTIGAYDRSAVRVDLSSWVRPGGGVHSGGDAGKPGGEWHAHH